MGLQFALSRENNYKPNGRMDEFGEGFFLVRENDN